MSLSAWVSDNEHEWRECLKPVRLVVETEFTADEVRAAHKRSCIRVGPSVEGGPSGPSPRLRRDMVVRIPQVTANRHILSVSSPKLFAEAAARPPVAAFLPGEYVR
ncbi:hypothetical protein FIV07_04160 [Mycobacterium sp. THAF192]|nr:hypothetical protein FIV07_04160 [Mycobacterium sp. THAF192]